jgi:Coenzyme PQQ synthesis protein D (PqqD)
MSDLFVSRAPKLAARKVAGEMVILNAEDSSLYVLNGVGTEIWEAVDGQTPVSAIVDRICRNYEVDRDTAQKDVDVFVADLVRHGVLAVL